MLDLKNGIALHPMKGIQAPSPAEGDVSEDFRVAAGAWDIISS